MNPYLVTTLIASFGFLLYLIYAVKDGNTKLEVLLKKYRKRRLVRPIAADHVEVHFMSHKLAGGKHRNPRR